MVVGRWFRYKKVADEICHRPCTGDLSVMCGGKLHNSVYTTVPPHHQFNVPPGCVKQASWFGKAAKTAEELRKQEHVIPEVLGKYVGCFSDHPGTPPT